MSLCTPFCIFINTWIGLCNCDCMNYIKIPVFVMKKIKCVF